MDAPAPAPESKITQPTLGFVGYARFFWRQLTSMRTALFLLLLLAVAAIPGSLVPQITSDPNGVIAYRANYPDTAAVLDFFQVFNTYSSVWFSSIYLLLFISLIGCVLPRTKHHFDALRARPPKTPARLSRLQGFTTRTTEADVETTIDSARGLLRSQRYRTELYGNSVSAERGYMRETGNLVFHAALVGVLVTVGLGGGFGYTGQRVVVEGYAFSNSLASYDSFNPGRFFTDDALEAYTIALDSFDAVYEQSNRDAIGQAIDYTANVTTTMRGEESQSSQVKVNEPLALGGTNVYLLGNGYAPVLTVRDADENVVWSQPTACLPFDANLGSTCIIKIPDGLDQQIGMLGFLYPTAGALSSGALASVYPDLISPVLTLEVYEGDLGLDNGLGTNAYALNTDSLQQIAGRTSDADTLELTPGDKLELPNGLGSVELTSIPRFVSFDVHHDPSQLPVLIFAILVVGGLVTSLFIPRRRMWVAAKTDASGTTTIEYAALARGDDPTLEAAVSEFAEKHSQQLRVRVDS
ncbi:cytochrome c biogenesis protein ResB [Salinibacterium sp. NK8237]|uniref:cytochrome c biogenesis protein ResB n=1 Tax=Salinibacterium sp. NK8237 TaxID=2792038 RepID=UPI0018CDC474|nr:cytochrome c biogenesis protein ResB [Salinibacterium sp. NK8237]